MPPSFPRKRESRGAGFSRSPWTPAFAGVTRTFRENQRSGDPFLLHHPLHRRARLHALVMRSTIRRQLHVEAAGGPELDVEQRRIGGRQLIAAEIVLAGERLVEDGKPLLDHLAAAGLDLVFGFGRTEIARPEDARETLPVHC